MVGLLCALLGFLLGKLLYNKAKELANLRSELEACRNQKEELLKLNSAYSNDIENWKVKFNKLSGDFEQLKLNLSSAVPVSVPFNAALAASVFGQKILQNDLKIVEGIGPKIEELFHHAGITTWKALAETPVEKCRMILDEAGEHFKIHDPETWPKQSELAYLGKWKELKEWQDKLLSGKE
ncbi:MAG: hypothetical protein PHD25_09415 [Bacteroidales bacterium]|nr:hypothetical protein [Bacteroidales bacterium]